MLTVRDRFSAPATTRPPTVVMDELIGLMATQAISAVPIVADAKLVGIVTSTDLVHASLVGSPNLVGSQLMRTTVRTIGPGESLRAAAVELTAARVHHLVVTENDRVLGILSARDLVGDVKELKLKEPISQFMTAKVSTVDIGDPIEQAVARLAESNVHGLVVLDERWPVGVFTQAEALGVRQLPPTLRARPVEEEMSYETICLDPSVPVYRAAGYLAALDARRILVVSNRDLVGVLSAFDLVRAMANAPM